MGTFNVNNYKGDGFSFVSKAKDKQSGNAFNVKDYKGEGFDFVTRDAKANTKPVSNSTDADLGAYSTAVKNLSAAKKAEKTAKKEYKQANAAYAVGNTDRAGVNEATQKYNEAVANTQKAQTERDKYYKSGTNFATGVQKGLNQIAQSGSSLLAMAEDTGAKLTPANYIKDILTGKKLGTTANEMDVFNKLNENVSKEGEYVNQLAQENLNKEGTPLGAEKVNEYTAMTVAAVPMAVEAIFSAGASLLPQSEALAIQAYTAANPGMMSTIYSGLRNMFANPNYYASMSQVMGPSYQQAKNDGASTEEALLYSIGNSLMNAAVEVGGGIQALPTQLRGGGAAWKAWVKSMLDEGKEEVVQGVIERAMQNVSYNKGNAVVSTTDGNAIFNPFTAAKEFEGGAVVGGILGAPSTIANTASRYNAQKRTPRAAQRDFSASAQEDSTADYNTAQGAREAVMSGETDNVIKSLERGARKGFAAQSAGSKAIGKAVTAQEIANIRSEADGIIENQQDVSGWVPTVQNPFFQKADDSFAYAVNRINNANDVDRPATTQSAIQEVRAIAQENPARAQQIVEEVSHDEAALEELGIDASGKSFTEIFAEATREMLGDDAVNASSEEQNNRQGTLGSAKENFTTPDSQSESKVSRAADRGQSLGYNSIEGDATALSEADYREKLRYKTVTEKQSMQLADDILYVDVDGERVFIGDYAPAVFDDIKGELTSAETWTGVMVDTAFLIKQELQERSLNLDITEDEYMAWVKNIQEHLTESGRATQAAAKWARQNGFGVNSESEAYDILQNSDLSIDEKHERFRNVLKYDQNIEQAKTNEDLIRIILDISQSRGVLNNALNRPSKVLRSVAERSLKSLDFTQLKNFAYQASANTVTDTIPANAGEKVKTIQVLNMLSSPKTPGSNLLGNTTFTGLDAMSMRGAALLDIAISNITGTRSVAMEKTLANRSVRQSIAKAIDMSLAEVTMDVNMDSGNRYNTKGKRTFSMDGSGILGKGTSVGKFTERVFSVLERNMGYLLTTTDEAYKGAARATEQNTQALIDSGKIKGAGENYANDMAESLAAYRTFQRDGKITAALQTIHDVLNLVGFGDSGKTLGRSKYTVHSFGIGDIASPFTRVAGNLISVSLDYNPITATKGVIEIADCIAKSVEGKSVDPVKQAKAVSDTARGLTGTALAAGVAVLASVGLIRRADDEGNEDVAKLNAAEGMRGTQFNISAAKRWVSGGSAEWENGDILIDLSRVEPLSFIMSFGTEFAKNDDPNDGIVSKMWNAAKSTGTASIQAAADLPVSGTVSRIAKDILVYKKDPIESAAKQAGSTVISSVTPNIVAAFARGIDENKRNIYSGDGFADLMIDTFKSRIPGLRESLPTTTDVTGNVSKYPGSLAERMANAMLNAVGVSRYTQSEMSKEMARVRESTGETGFYPTTRKPDEVEYTVDGVKNVVPLTYEQSQSFQSTYSKTQEAVTTELINTADYQSANDATKAALLDRAESYAYQTAKADVIGKDNIDEWVNNAETAKQDIGVSTAEYFSLYEKYGSRYLSGNGYDKTKEAHSHGISVDSYVQYKESVSGLEADKDKNGKSIDGSKKAKVVKAINRTGLSKKQKDWLYISAGYSESGLSETPWN